MGDSRFGRKIRAAVKFLTSHPQPLDPTKKYPVRVRYAFLWAAGILFLEWYYFYVQVPYDSIPGKPLFWVAFVGWAMPGIIVEWVYRNVPTKRLIDKYANWFMGIGAVAIVLGIASKRTDALLPVAYALVPGFLAGAVVGSDSLLVWKLIKKMRTNSNKTSEETVSDPKYPPGLQAQEEKRETQVKFLNCRKLRNAIIMGN